MESIIKEPPLQEKYPKHIFVHIPKTGGSSVNKTLNHVLGNGIEHVENKIQTLDFNSKLVNLNWISGHVPIRKYNALLPKNNNYKFITIVRKPTSQIISHIKWQFAIYEKGRHFFQSHSKENQKIALDAMSLDYKDPDALIGFLLKNKGLFLNFQSNFILAKLNRGRVDPKILLNDLKQFDFICTTDTIYEMLPNYLGAQKIVREETENKNSKTYFDEKIFEHKKVVNFLSSHNSTDIDLFNFVENSIKI